MKKKRYIRTISKPRVESKKETVNEHIPKLSFEDCVKNLSAVAQAFKNCGLSTEQINAALHEVAKYGTFYNYYAFGAKTADEVERKELEYIHSMDRAILRITEREGELTEVPGLIRNGVFYETNENGEILDFDISERLQRARNQVRFNRNRLTPTTCREHREPSYYEEDNQERNQTQAAAERRENAIQSRIRTYRQGSSLYNKTSGGQIRRFIPRRT